MKSLTLIAGCASAMAFTTFEISRRGDSTISTPSRLLSHGLATRQSVSTNVTPGLCYELTILKAPDRALRVA